jgi:hypothetical protein
MNCEVCQIKGRTAEAVAVCNRVGTALCNQHAGWCIREGHGVTAIVEGQRDVAA